MVPSIGLVRARSHLFEYLISVIFQTPMPRGGRRDNSGRKPIWDVEQIRKAIKAHTATWWTEIAQMMTSADPGEKRFALSEFNKLQVKALPQQLTGEGGGPIQIQGVEISVRK